MLMLGDCCLGWHCCQCLLSLLQHSYSMSSQCFQWSLSASQSEFVTTSQGVSNLRIAPVVKKVTKNVRRRLQVLGFWSVVHVCLTYSSNTRRAELLTLSLFCVVWFKSRIHSRQTLPCFASYGLTYSYQILAVGGSGRRLVWTCFNSSLHVYPCVPSCWIRKAQFLSYIIISIWFYLILFNCPGRTSARCQTIHSAGEQLLKRHRGTRKSRLVSTLANFTKVSFPTKAATSQAWTWPP